MKLRPVYLLAALPLMLGAAMPFAIANTGQDGLFLAQATEEKSERRGRFKAERRQKMIEALNLSDEQVQQFDAIRAEGKSAAQDRYEAIRAEMETMRSLVSSSASTSELRSQHQKIQALKQEMGAERFENMLKVYDILTPEQRQTFAENIGKGRRSRFGRRSRRGPSSELQSSLAF